MSVLTDILLHKSNNISGQYFGYVVLVDVALNFSIELEFSKMRGMLYYNIYLKRTKVLCYYLKTPHNTI